MDKHLLGDLPPLQEPTKDGAPLRRPMNAFLIFCKKHRAMVREKNRHLDNRSVTRILGELWATLPTGEKDSYLSLAKQYRDAFLKANPGYHWHSHKRENQAAFKPVQRNMPAVFTSTIGSNNRVIEAGKLADPSNMGGLGLLLMAGSGVPAPPHPHTAMRPPLQQPGKVPTRPLVSSTATRATPTDGMDNVALLQLAEMCSSRLESKERHPSGNSDNSKSRGESHAINQQQWVSGSYAMTPPWTPQYEGQGSPKHDLSPTEPKDFPLDLSKPATFESEAKVVAATSLSKKSGTSAAQSEHTIQKKAGEITRLKPYAMEIDSKSMERIKWDSQDKGMAVVASSINKKMDNNGLVDKRVPMAMETSEAGRPCEMDAKSDRMSQHQDHNSFSKSSGEMGSGIGKVPSGRMLVNQMIETVFHSDMLLEPKKKGSGLSSPPAGRKRSVSMSDDRSTTNTIDGGATAPTDDPSDTRGAPAAMTFGEIQEKLIRKAMEDSIVFSSNGEKRGGARANPLPLNLSHAGMDLAVGGNNMRNLNNFAMFTGKSGSSSSHPTSPAKTCQGQSDQQPTANRLEATNIGLMRDAMLDRFKQERFSPRELSESVDLTCKEELEGYDSEDNRGSKAPKVLSGRGCGGSGLVGQRLRDQIETQLASHLMASAGVLPLRVVSCDRPAIGILAPKDAAVSGINRGGDPGNYKTNWISSAANGRDTLKDKTEESNIENTSLSSLNNRVVKSELGFSGQISPVDEKCSFTAGDRLPGKPQNLKGKNKKDVTNTNVTVTSLGDLVGAETSTNQEPPEKKVRRRRRNVMEMTLDPYGENTSRGQHSSNGSESPEEKPQETDLLDNTEEDDSGVRKSKRRNRGQKYQELLSQGLLQVGRQRKSDSISESQEGVPLDQPVLKRPRKSQTSDTSPNVSRDEVFMDNTGFDLDAEIASLPALALPVAPLGGTSATRAHRGSGTRVGMRARGRHRSEHHMDGVNRGRPLVAKDGNGSRKRAKVKELSIAELGRFTKFCQTTAELKSGSQKRKARKCAITHLVPVKQTDQEANNNQNLENQPSEKPTDPSLDDIATKADNGGGHGNHLDFATLVDVAVAENEKLRNLKEITVSCR